MPGALRIPFVLSVGQYAHLALAIRVLYPYNPWDHSTRGQQKNNITDMQAMATLLKDTGAQPLPRLCLMGFVVARMLHLLGSPGADGFNGDTMQHIPKV